MRQDAARSPAGHPPSASPRRPRLPEAGVISDAALRSELRRLQRAVPPPPRRRPLAPRILAGTAILLALAGVVGVVFAVQSLGSPGRVHTPRAATRVALAGPGHGVARAMIALHLPTGVAATLPFAPDPSDRPARTGEVPSLYADGLDCSTGCRPYGALDGWPLAPFHSEHPLRAGLNELRPGSLHVGLDIQARDRAPVYAVQGGQADVLDPSGPNARVRVGNYVYWHIVPAVVTGQWVTPFVTKLGTVMPGYGHIAFSELGWHGEYVNPLRPGGSVLVPYVNTDPPEIARPTVAAGGQVIVAAYSPQSFVRRTTYLTPVLAPAALAYRLYTAGGVAITPLEWAFRGTHLLPWSERELIYAPDSHAPGYGCFATRPVCVPDWVYRVAGGLAPPLPFGLAPGSYRLTIYAWDWADNTTALDTTLTMTPTGWRPLGRFPAALYAAPDYFTEISPVGSLPRTWSTPVAGSARSGGETPGQCCASSASFSPSVSPTR